MDELTTGRTGFAPRFAAASAKPALRTREGVSLRSIAEAARRMACVPSLYLALSGIALTRPLLPGGLYIALVLGLMAVAWKMPRSDYRLFLLYILAFSLFLGLRVYGDATGIPVSFAYPIDIDRAIFGVVPTVWLQDQFYTSGQPGLLGWAAISVYTSYFMGHFWLGLAIWAFRRKYLTLHATAIIACFMLGLVFYYLVPTSPPWLAGETGHLPEVTRIVHVTMSETWAAAEQQGTFIAGRNDVAAMPSLHTAITVVMAMMLWRINRALGVIGWLYAAAMSFSLMYLGEHYLVDVAGGLVLAAASFRLADRLVRLGAVRALRSRTSAAMQDAPAPALVDAA